MRARAGSSITRGALALLCGLAAQAPLGARAGQYGDANGFLSLKENAPLCVSENLPPAQRIASCTAIIATALHGTALPKAEIAKIYLARAQAFEQDGDEQAALKDLNTAVSDDPRSELPWIGLANFYVARSDYAQALANYDRALAIAHTDPVVYDDRGAALEALGRHEQAIADFSRAIALDSQDTSAYSNRATAYLATMRPALAIADLTQVIRADPTNGRAFYDRGTAYELSGALEKAEDDYRAARQRAPAFAPASAALGRLLANQDPAEALADLNAAIRIDPKSPALRARAQFYLSRGQPARALSDLDQVIANDASDSTAYVDRGVAKATLGRLESAIDDYTRSIDLAPTAAAYVDRGAAYRRLKQPGRAIANFTAALEIDPKSAPALLGRAAARHDAGWLTQSLDDYTRVIEADPTNATAFLERGNVDLDLGQFAAAFRDYSGSLKLDPNQPVALYNRSIAAARLGRLSDAARDQHRALTLDPSLDSGARHER